jgi:hypothetical protein
MRLTVFVCSLTMVVCLLAASGARAETIPVAKGGNLCDGRAGLDEERYDDRHALISTFPRTT